MLKGIPLWKVNSAIAGLWGVIALLNFVGWQLQGRTLSLILVIINLVLVFMYTAMAMYGRPHNKQTPPQVRPITKATETPLPWETKNTYIDHPDDLR